MRAILLVNTSAGRIRSEPSLADPAAWQRRFRAAGMEGEAWCVPAFEVAPAAQQAARSDADCVVAAGGDGTVRTIAEALAGGDKPLAVLPVGTLNHFARDLGMPLDVDEALRVIATGQVRRIDIGEVNGRVFVNNSSVGIYSRMVLLRDAQRPPSRWRKFLAMAVACVRILRRFPRLTATLRVAGQAISRTVPLIVICNNPYETAWPQLGRRPELDGGRLGVYVVRCSSRFELLRCVFRALRNRLDRIDSIEMTLTTALSIATHRRRLRVSLDGEVERLSTPLTYRCRPRELLVIAPPPVGPPRDGRGTVLSR
ncbi:MAG TPA: diacylglycerol kinase family protein [Planctomycetaceae bacterium]|nr:diacylglycerol kinase family protein [Planctomycetaceae bacterium]